ncbi:MAG TPA: ubiquinol-cytochrome c reductase iron-sulfur subunit, partial [Neisseria sp.]|nr:ubiquinol-cytochrome c reductase iron-sulfur subunit [Neisseria sp.]
MDNKEINQGRRRFLTLATAGAGGVAAVGVAAPFLASWFPSEKAKAAGAPIEVDISKIEAGQLMTVEWQGKPIWVLNRTEAQQKSIPAQDGEMADPSSDVDH